MSIGQGITTEVVGYIDLYANYYQNVQGGLLAHNDFTTQYCPGANYPWNNILHTLGVAPIQMKEGHRNMMGRREYAVNSNEYWKAKQDYEKYEDDVKIIRDNFIKEYKEKNDVDLVWDDKFWRYSSDEAKSHRIIILDGIKDDMPEVPVYNLPNYKEPEFKVHYWPRTLTAVQVDDDFDAIQTKREAQYFDPKRKSKEITMKQIEYEVL